VIVWCAIAAIVRSILIFFRGAVRGIIVFRSAVEGAAAGLTVRVASTVLVLFWSVVGWIVVFGCRRVDRALTTLAVLASEAIGARLNMNIVKHLKLSKPCHFTID
jgi:hypothetical protein